MGGNTVFPKAKIGKVDQKRTPSTLNATQQYLNISESSWERKMADECEASFSIAPRKGDALLFYSQQPDGSLDEASLHGGCPVLEGVKWAANVWIWNGCRYGVCKNPPPRR